MGYAFAAIPIWLTKMGMLYGGAKTVIYNFLDSLDALMNYVTLFLHGNFAAMISGNDNNESLILNYNGTTDSFKFFPSINSPFFILWMLFLAAGVLLMLILIVMHFVKKLSASELEETGGTGRLGKMVISSIIMIFFVPFIVFSSMTITSSVTRALFKSDTSTSDKGSTSEYNSVVAKQLKDFRDNTGEIGKNNHLKIASGEPNALYSHTSSLMKDVDERLLFNNPTNLSPFKTTQSLFTRIRYELSFLAKNNDKLFDMSVQYSITQAMIEINKYNKNYLANNKILDGITKLENYAKGSGEKDQAKLKKIKVLAGEMQTFKNAAKKMFATLQEVINEGDLITSSLTGGEGVRKALALKYSGLYLSSNPTKNIHILSKAAVTGFVPSKASDIPKMNKFISYLNLYSLTKTYLAPGTMNNKKDWATTFAYHHDTSVFFSSGTTLMDSFQNLNKLVTGYEISNSSHTISLGGLGYTYSSYERTPLSKIIQDIAGSGSGFLEPMIVTLIATFVIFLSVMLLYQLVKRMVERISKLIFLWIAGMIIIPSSTRDGSQSIKTWFGMVATEMVVLLGMGLGFEVWGQMTPLVLGWIDKLSVNDSLARAVFKAMVALAFLESVIKFSDWLLQSLGGSSDMGKMKTNIQGKLGKSQQGMKNQFDGKGMKKGISEGIDKGYAGGKNGGFSFKSMFGKGGK